MKRLVASALWLMVALLFGGIWWYYSSLPHHDDELFGPVSEAMAGENAKVESAAFHGDFKEAHARLDHLRRWSNTIQDTKMRNAVLYNIYLREYVVKDYEHDAELKSSIPVPPPYQEAVK